MQSVPEPTTIADWVVRDAIPFDLNDTASFNAAVDRLLAAIGDSVDLLGLGEPMHGAEEFLTLRNRLFQRLVEKHGFTAIALESSFPRGFAANDYICGNRNAAATYADVEDTGFSHDFGKLASTRALVEWMRDFNAGRDESVKLHIYGCDSPTEMMYTDSPRRLIEVALDYLTSIDATRGQLFRDRITPHLGNDADWENTAANMDASKSIGLSPAAKALRLETEDLITELCTRRPELVAASDSDRFSLALRHAEHTRQLLTYHAGVAGNSPNRLPELLGQRDAMMADNLAWIVERERPRGRVLAFAHNSHLKCGRAEWQMGPQLLAWWPAGAHVREMLGPRYAVIGTAVGTSEAHGIATPEPGSLESHLISAPGPDRFISTHRGEHLAASAIAILSPRGFATKNPGYFPLSPQSLTEYDWLVALNRIA